MTFEDWWERYRAHAIRASAYPNITAIRKRQDVDCWNAALWAVELAVAKDEILYAAVRPKLAALRAKAENENS